MGIAAAAGVSLQNRAQLSDVALANIEAIAAGEGAMKGFLFCVIQVWNQEIRGLLLFFVVRVQPYRGTNLRVLSRDVREVVKNYK